MKEKLFHSLKRKNDNFMIKSLSSYFFNFQTLYLFTK